MSPPPTQSRRDATPPAVSVIVPAYNREDTVGRAVDSVLAQSFADFEVLVVDDGSTDGTAEAVRAFEDDRVRLHPFPVQRGANAARNAGVDRAKGEFVSFLDSDDELHPDHLERVVAALRSESGDCDGVYTGYQHVRDGRVVYVSSPRAGPVSYEELHADNIIGVFSCVSVRASVLEDVRLDEELRCWQDYDFFLRMARSGYRMCGIAETLVSCHQSGQRIGTSPERALEGTRRFLEKHGDELADRGRSKVHYYRAFRYGHAGQWREAREEFGRAIRRDPTRWLAYFHLFAAFHPASYHALLGVKRRVRALARRVAGDARPGGRGPQRESSTRS